MDIKLKSNRVLEVNQIYQKILLNSLYGSMNMDIEQHYEKLRRKLKKEERNKKIDIILNHE